MEGKQHAEVVAAIKAGGDDTTLLVVDPETDAFFKKCRVMPNAEHLTGTSTKHKVKLSVCFVEDIFNRFPAAVLLLATSRWRLTHRVIVWQGLLRQACLSRCAGFGFPIKQFSLSVSFCYSCQQFSTVPNAAMETMCVCVCLCLTQLD